MQLVPRQLWICVCGVGADIETPPKGREGGAYYIPARSMYVNGLAPEGSSRAGEDGGSYKMQWIVNN